jgi:hypothetical protein
MKKIVYILPKSRSNFTFSFFNKQKSILDGNINKKKIKHIKKNKITPYVFHKAQFDTFLENNIKVVIWNGHPFSMNNYDKFLKKYENFLINKKLYISTFGCYKHLVKNFVPFYPPKSLEIKIKKKLFFKKKFFDIIFLSGSNNLKFKHYILYLPIYLISLFFWRKKFLLKEIFKKPFVKFFSLFSFGSVRTKYFILMIFMKNLRRNYIKKELEKINDINIFYAGSEKFFPSNCKRKQKWIDHNNSLNILSRSKLIIITESFCNEPNERLFFMKFGCLPIIEDNLWIRKKNIDKNLIFNFKNGDLEKKIRLVLKKKNIENFSFISSKLIANQVNNCFARLRDKSFKVLKKIK